MSQNVYVRDLCNQLHRLDLNHESESSIESVQQFVEERCGIPVQHQSLWHNGKRFTHLSSSSSYHEISVHLSVCGGKGGFGSMLRAAGKLNKTTNKSAMRDLSGRRQRYVEQEKELLAWMDEQQSDSTVKKTPQQIQKDFLHIKQHGKLPEEPEHRMCHRGLECRDRLKGRCQFRHTDDEERLQAAQLQSQSQSTQIKRKQRSQQIYNQLHEQTDDDMHNALLMGSVHAKQRKQQQQQQKQQHKDDEDVDGCRHVPHVDAKNLNREILDVDKHAHKLVYVSRTDCDFVICDCCDKQFVGASWHCAKQCDFDVCEDCVCVSELSIEVASDAHIEHYNQQPALLKQIEQRDQNVMRIAAFSREVDRKRKRNEKKLKLMQLETKTQQPQKRKLPAIKTTDKEQEQDEDKNIKQSEPEENEDNVVDVATGDIDLSQIADIEQLKACGLEALKKDLQCYGLKCGGTLQERAERLFLLKHSKLNTLPKHCFATKKKKSHKPPAKKRQKL